MNVVKRQSTQWIEIQYDFIGKEGTVTNPKQQLYFVAQNEVFK